LNNNEFFGTIPGFRVQKLEVLHLDGNALSGEIPEIASLAMRELRLDVNTLSGSLTSRLGSLEALEIMRLEYNRLVGTVPEEFGKLKQIGRCTTKTSNTILLISQSFDRGIEY